MTRMTTTHPPFSGWVLMLMLMTMLCACGFQLRGSTKLPFKSIYMTFADNSPLGVELKRHIRTRGDTIVMPTAEGAQAILEVLSQTQEKVILTLNSAGRASEYILYSKLTFRVRDAQQKELLAPTTITLKRDISYNISQELSKTAEEALLYRDMQTDMVQQILRRLAAIKYAPATPVPSTEPVTPSQSAQ